MAWQHSFCGLMSVIYALCIAMGVFMLVYRDEAADEQHSATELFLVGAGLVVLGLLLSIAFGVAPFLSPAPWVWTFHLVLIAFTMTSVCCLPVAIPLLIGWIKADTKAYFGRA